MLNDELFSLIKSLDGSEKRYFKVFAQLHTEKDRNRYILLFDLIDAQQAYDEKRLKQGLEKAGETSFSSNLSFNKRYLYDLLLKCLRNYHAKRSARITLLETMIDIAILQEKALIKPARILIDKARSMAGQYNHHAIELDLIAQQRKIVRQFATKDAEEELEAIVEANRRILDRYERELNVLGLYEKVFLQSRNKNYPEKQLTELNQEIWRTVGNQPGEPDFSFDGVAYFHLLRSLVNRLNGRPEEVVHHWSLLIQHFEKHPELLRETEYQERYLNTLNNYFSGCNALGLIDECEAVVEKIGRIEAASARLKASVFHTMHYCNMLLLAQKENYAAIVKEEPEIEKGLKTYAANIPQNRQIVFRYNLAVAYYLERQPDIALDRITAIVQDGKKEMRQDVQFLARLFHLALHYEKGNELLVENMLPVIRQYVRKNRKPESVEASIVEALHISTKTGDRSALAALKNKLDHVKGWEEFKFWVRQLV
ncbi:MAG: hypothetical protein IT259_06680 [Saprospiraceae bacterium]|nr:hypothetical protein [Saprospiraceae bacterium]